MSEASVALSAVLEWVLRTDRETAVALIVGCDLDDGEANLAIPIAGLDWSDAAQPVAFVLDDGRRLPVRRLVASARVVDGRPGAPLVAAVDATRHTGGNSRAENAPGA